MDTVGVLGFTGIPWIASHPIAYPALEVLHIAGIALLLGSLVLLSGLLMWLAAIICGRWIAYV